MYACLGLFFGGDGGLVRRVTRDEPMTEVCLKGLQYIIKSLLIVY